MFNVLPASPLLFALEPVNAVVDYIFGHLHRRDLSLRGDGHPVLVFPGFTLNGSSTADLRVRLQQLDYAVYDWRQGFNYGPGFSFDIWLGMLSEHLLEIHEEHQRPVSIIGCSLGGIYARELAKLHPELVRQVITLATPFFKPGIESSPDNRFDPLAGASLFMNDDLLQRLSEAPPVRSASIYSETDGFVSWQSCIGAHSAHHRNVALKGVSHLGMAHHPEVLNIIAGLLKHPAAMR